MTTPVREIKHLGGLIDSGDPGYVNRILVGTPAVGTVRIEWVLARFGQMIPMNWSMVTALEYMSPYFTMRYQVADAQNMLVKTVIEKDFEWLFLHEHDVLLPPHTFIKLNKYMRDGNFPIVSGLYYSRSRPSEPLVFRGRGNSVYTDFELPDDQYQGGQLIYVDGVPTGCLLVHHSILKEMWKDAEEYPIKNQTTRRVFNTPRDLWFDPQEKWVNATTGTSDLDWCTRVMNGDYLRKAGWGDYVDSLENPEYPFVIDTNIFCRHINLSGEQFP